MTLLPPPIAVYGTPRMLMAVLDKELLAQTCTERTGADNMWEVLGPLRAVRPVNGGRGYDAELIGKLRMLHFQIPPPSRSNEKTSQ